MNLLVKSLGGIAVAAMFVLPATAADKDVIDYRINIMASIGKQSAALGAVLQGKVPPDNLGGHARSIHVAVQQARKAFVPNVPGGTSKPDVWTNWKDFDERFAKLEAVSLEVAELADKGDRAGAQAKVKEMLTCKTCHDVYRTPQK